MQHGHLQIPPQHLTKEPIPVKWMQRFHYMNEMMQKIKNVPGDIVECGIGEGTTFAMLAFLANNLSGPYKRSLRGFDSFQGFPEPSEYDKSWRDPQQGEWSFEKKVVEDHLEKVGIYQEYPDLEIKITPGFFRDTLPRENENYKIAFLHADGDLYESYKDILENLYPKVSSGGIILFDEYKEYTPNKGEKWPGATRAIDEYLKPLGLEPQKHLTGKYFLIKP